ECRRCCAAYHVAYKTIQSSSTAISSPKSLFVTCVYYSPPRNLVHGSDGRLARISLIQSNCGCAAKNCFASKALPQAEPQRASKLNFRAIVASTTFASIVPLQPKGIPGQAPVGNGSNSKCPQSVRPPGRSFPR